jgi:predicted Zn-dependent protease
MNVHRFFAVRGAVRALLAATLVALLAVACAVSPTGRKQLTLMPEQQMVTMGAQAFAEIRQDTPRESNAAIVTYVQCVADALTALPEVNGQQAQWEVVVFGDDTVNAFALPGGKIGVYRGLLTAAKTPDQLAAVMGHEVAHVLARHGNERVSQQFAVSETLGLIDAWMASGNSAKREAAMGLLGVGAQVGVLLPFSRAHESEADAMGKELMARAGFDPRESVRLWENMAKLGGSSMPGFMSTHPSHDTRIRDLQKGMDGAVALYEQARAAGRTPRCKAPALG